MTEYSNQGKADTMFDQQLNSTRADIMLSNLHIKL